PAGGSRRGKAKAAAGSRARAPRPRSSPRRRAGTPTRPKTGEPKRARSSRLRSGAPKPEIRPRSRLCIESYFLQAPAQARQTARISPLLAYVWNPEAARGAEAPLRAARGDEHEHE